MKSVSLEDKIEDMCRRCERTYTPVFTSFLTPEEQAKAMLVSKSYPDVLPLAFGGVAFAERCLIGFFHGDITAEPQTEQEKQTLFCDAPVKYIKVMGSGFAKIGHRDVLGSLMGLGIKRDMIGDILISNDEKTAYVVMLASVVAYVMDSLVKVGRDTVKLKEVPVNLVPAKEQKFADLSVTLSSLRVDALLSAVLNLSREKAKHLVNTGCLILDYTECKSCDKEFSENSIFSVKGYGKFAVDGFLGKTAKDRYRVIVRKYM